MTNQYIAATFSQSQRNEIFIQKMPRFPKMHDHIRRFMKSFEVLWRRYDVPRSQYISCQKSEISEDFSESMVINSFYMKFSFLALV